MTDDARFWSFAIVSVTLIALWAIESGRVGLLKTVWTTPDNKYSVGASYQGGTAAASSGSSSGLLGDVLGGVVGIFG
jgi:hypothetical protein